MDFYNWNNFDEIKVVSSYAQQLTVMLEPNEGGVVTASGITCGNGSADCGENYAIGSVVTLTAEENPGFVFDHWDDGTACFYEKNYPVTMDGGKNVKAVFAATANLSVVIEPPDAGTVIGNLSPQIECGNGNIDCEQTYVVGLEVELSVAANSGWVFDCWSDGTKLYWPQTLPVVMSGLKTLKAVFRPSAVPLDTQVTLQVPALDQDDSQYEFMDSSGRTGPAGCVPTSFTMMFLHYYNRNNPDIQVDTSAYSYNTVRILETMAEHLAAYVQGGSTWVINSTVTERMREYMVTFDTFSDPPTVSLTWDIDYYRAPLICAHQVMDFLKQKLTAEEAVYVSGSTMASFGSGGHAVLVTGYKKENGIESLRINDTWSNESQWCTVSITESENPDGTLFSAVALDWSYQGDDLIDLLYNGENVHMTIDGLIANPRVITVIPF